MTEALGLLFFKTLRHAKYADRPTNISRCHPKYRSVQYETMDGCTSHQETGIRRETLYRARCPNSDPRQKHTHRPKND